MKPDVMRLPKILWAAARRPLDELWRAVRRGDQAALVGTLMQLADSAADPDVYYLDARPISPRILVAHSIEGLTAMASAPALDKGPTANVAVAVSGDAAAYEAVMGSAREPRYGLQMDVLQGLIKQRQRGLRSLVEARVDEHLALPCAFDLKTAQRFAASVILEDIFPAHDWSAAAILSFVETIEANAVVIGPAVQSSAMRGASAAAVLRRRGVPEAAASYEAIFADLAHEERAKASTREGLLTKLERAGLPWCDSKAVLTSLVAASYETVATSLTELVYQLSYSPALWSELATSEGEARRRLVKHALYEAVRIINPLPFLLRRAERACTLRIKRGESTRELEIDAGQLVIGLLVRPLLDPARFPDPYRLRLDLDSAQIEVIRLAWGLRPGPESSASNRFCKGFAYSVTLLSATLEVLLRNCAPPQRLAGGPIEMYGTRSRKRFRARLRARS